MPGDNDKTDAAASSPAMPIKIFYSYSSQDEELRDKLDAHLSVLMRNGVVAGWHDRRISAGTEWADSIDRHLESAEIILLLISADFLASDYCYEKEMRRAMERHERGEARVIPIILRNCDWSDTPFGKLPVLPNGGKPITNWRSTDDALANVVAGLKKAIAELTDAVFNEPRTSESVQRSIESRRLTAVRSAQIVAVWLWAIMHLTISSLLPR